MKAKINSILVSVFLLLVIAAPAKAEGLVICTNDCTFDKLVNQVVTVVNFLIDSATLLAIAYVLYGGINMILARGNPAKFEQAKTTMSSAVQGLIIVLIAYMIVSFVIAFLTGGKTFDQIFNFLPHQ